ncbi:MAG: hypothetical protein JXR91_04640 [Deltaproteobacteria bacterium]|nr:hypothetical protein [Deltaproteobacteria bacterium]
MKFLSFLNITNLWKYFVKAICYSGRYPEFLVVAIVGGVLAVIDSIYGVALSPDSIFYIKTATFMHYSHNFNTIVTVWPPLYPFVINLFLYITPYPAVAASMATGFFTFANLLLFAFILRQIIDKVQIRLLIILCLISITGYWYIFTLVLSESLFITLVLGHIYFVNNFIKSKKVLFFFPAAATAAMAVLSRYIGYSLFLAFGLLTFYSLAKEQNIKNKFLIFGTFIISLIPGIFWIIRNYRIEESFHGIRNPSNRTIIEIISQIINTCTRDLNEFYLLLFGLIIVFFIHRTLIYFKDNKRQTNSTQVIEFYIYALLSFYMILLSYAAASTNIDNIDSRTAILFYVGLFLVTAIGLQQLDNISISPVTKKIAIGTISIFLIFGLINNCKPIANYFSKLSRVDKKQKEYTFWGFEQTDNAKKISSYTTNLFKKNDKIILSTLYNKKKQRPYLAYAFLLRKFVWANDKISNIKYTNILSGNEQKSPNYLSQQCDLDVTFKFDGKPKQLIYRGLPPIRNLGQITNHLKKHMKDNNTKKIYLLDINGFAQNQRITEIAVQQKNKKQLNGLKIKLEKKLDGFSFYEFTTP